MNKRIKNKIHKRNIKKYVEDIWNKNDCCIILKTKEAVIAFSVLPPLDEFSFELPHRDCVNIYGGKERFLIRKELGECISSKLSIKACLNGFNIVKNENK